MESKLEQQSKSLGLHPAFKANDQQDFELQFQIAKEYFADHPDENKLHRGDKEKSVLQFTDDYELFRDTMKNSFIRIEGKPHILMLGSVKESHTLGTGTSGRVKFAIDENQELYVVKIIHEKKEYQLDRVDSLSEEAMHTPKTPQSSMIDAEHAKLSDLGQALGDSPTKQDNKFYIVAQYLGPSLYKRLAHNTMQFEERLQLAIQVSLAVHELHSGELSAKHIRYAHGDLKPDNITINDHGVHIIDYGSCMLIDDPSTHQMQGSGIYMPVDTADITVEELALQNAAQQILTENGPIYCDLIALKRLIYLTPALQECKHALSILRQEDYDKLPLRLQQTLNSDRISDTDNNETAIGIVTDLSNYLVSLRRQYLRALPSLTESIKSHSIALISEGIIQPNQINDEFQEHALKEKYRSIRQELERRRSSIVCDNPQATNQADPSSTLT